MPIRPSLACWSSAALLSALSTAASAAQAPWTADEFVTVSGPAGPAVALALRSDGPRLLLAVDVEGFAADGGDTRLALGLAAGKALTFGERDAQVRRGDHRTRYEFAVPLAGLGVAFGAASSDASSDALSNLRLGLAASWTGGPGGADRQRERLRHEGGAAHAGLGEPREWQPFDIAEYRALVADRGNRIAVPLAQPLDGKATVVIEDAASGKRIRNLLAGAPLAKGAQRIAWDGLDDRGTVVAPGTYRWRSLHHPGVAPQYLMSFGNGDDTIAQFSGWGPNHTILNAATASGPWTVVASPMTEGGHAIVVLGADGTKTTGMNPPMGMGMAKITPAIIGDTLYIANDGLGWGNGFKQDDPNGVAKLTVTLARFDLSSGQLQDYAGKHFRELWTAEAGPGAADKDWRTPGLTGMAALDDKLYLADRRRGGITVIDPASGKPGALVKLAQPGALASGGGKLYAVSAGAIVAVDPMGGATRTVVPAGTCEPLALAVAPDGRICVSDGRTSTVLVFSPEGRRLRQLGVPGGPYTGTWVRERMVAPRGLAVAANGWLWVTDEDPSPKRILAWDLASGAVVCEKYGTPPYGGSGSGGDPADASRWVGMGALWKVDAKNGTAVPTARLGDADEGVMNYTWVHEQKRTYLLAGGGVTTVLKLGDDGAATPVAVIASAHRYSYQHQWHPPQPFIDAFNRAYPQRVGKHGDKGPGFVWTDVNGDGRMEAEEFDFATGAEDFAGAYFGHAFKDLTLRVPARVGGRTVLVTLKPEGFTTAGVPRYPTLAAACAAAPAIDLAGNQVETAVDRFGDLLCNSSPEMRAFAPDGKLLWTYPNRWAGVHGSHEAPLPEVGVLQGALFFLGTAPLDERSDVFVMNGNHGRFFVMTSDGLYVDELFNDVRMGASMGVNLIGGECFGGAFMRSAKDGTFYLQAGSYRLYRLAGLDRATRDQGTLTVSPAQVLAAERALAKRSVAQATARVLAIPRVAAPPPLDARGTAGWPGDGQIAWDRSGQFRTTVRTAHDGTTLYLLYEVDDASPWVNNGQDWTLLFKTGDSVDLQLGSFAAGADPRRTAPVPGDLRLLVAPFQGKDIAVLYRHRQPGATDPITFTCPWRAEKVDSVSRLDAARIAVAREGGRYRVAVAVPFAALGVTAPAGRTVKADFGVIHGDPEGTMNLLRAYWANPSTGLVNDVPGEIMLTPGVWGDVTFASGQGAAP